MTDLQALLSTLHRDGVQFWVQEGQLRYRCRSGPLGSARIADIQRQKEEIIAFLEEPSETSPLADEQRPAALPLSFAQEGLWFLDQFGMLGSAYNVPTLVRIEGPLDMRLLKRAVTEIVRRHEILRTRFQMTDGVAAQVIDPPYEVPVGFTDLSPLEPARREERRRELVLSLAEHEFGLEREHSFRSHVLRLGEEEYIFLLNMHHIVSDARSTQNFLDEFCAIYAAFRGGRPSPLPEPTAQYADYAIWQKRWLSGRRLSEHLDYWRARLAGAPQSLDLPADRPRPALQSVRGGWFEFTLPPEVREAVGALARRSEMTPFMVLLAVFDVLLWRWSGQRDVLVGTPIDGRNHPDAEPLIGYFLNTLVLRSVMREGMTFAGLLSEVKSGVLEAYEHREVPFDRLVAELRPERDGSRQPLFQVLFTYQQGMSQGGFDIPGLDLKIIHVENRSSKFDLSLFVWETADGLKCNVEYSTDLFDRETIGRLVGHYRTLLDAAVADPQAPIGRLPLLTPGERRQLLVEWNEDDHGAPPAATIHRLFEERAASDPSAVAVVAGAEQLSYGQLNERANRLAHHLRALGVGPEQLVAVCHGRSAGLLVALLGVLKAGAAYLPLDPEYPAERLAFMLADSGARVVVTEEALRGRLPEHEAHVVSLDADWAAVAESPGHDPAGPAEPENLAYCIYTSGSTGRPKGVSLLHSNAVAFISWATRAFTAEQLRRVLASTSVCFDLSVFELFVPLSIGATVVLVRDALALTEEKIEPAPTLINTVPSAAQALLAAGAMPPEVQVVNLAGEPLSPSLVGRLRAALPGARVYNLYGPTEYTTYTTYTEVEAGERVTVGRPVANTRVYVLDGEGEPAPAGVPGELYAGGQGLARGYSGRPALTAERFVPDPHSGLPGARLYRTGDLVRYLRDGRIEFLGRIDHQVKVRGFRIELGEVESALLRCEGVKDCVVAAAEDDAGERRLVGYVVWREGARGEAGELPGQLRERLPEYMVPGLYVELDELPLTPNGKVDRRALPSPEGPGPAGTEYVGPRTTAEGVIAGIWAEVLKVARVGVHDDFFQLGGHSLLAAQVAARIKQALQTSISLRDFFVAPTVAQLAKHLGTAQVARRTPITRVRQAGRPPASFAQQRLWFLDQFEPGKGLYNMPAAWRVGGPLDVPALERAINEIVRRHESLRTTFAAENGSPVQVIADDLHLSVRLFDVSAEPDALARAQAITEEEADLPFDLEAGPLIRVGLVRLSEQQHVLMITTHHIIGDGWSLAVILGELSALYRAYVKGRPSPLPEMQIQYADYAVWQREYLTGEALDGQLAFWRRYLEGAPKTSELPADRPRPQTPTHRGAEVPFELSDGLSAGLRGLSQRAQVTLFMTLAAAFNVLLQRYSRQDDICIGYPVGNRNRVEVEGLIGFFVNMLVLRTRMTPGQTFETLLAQVRECMLDAEANQDLPFEKLVEELRPERDTSRQPLFQVSYSYSTTHVSGSRATGSLPGVAEAVLSLAGLEVSPAVAEQGSVKFDLNLFISDSPEGLEGTVDYATDLFDRPTIERLVGHFKCLLQGVVADPQTPIGRIPILTTEERRQLVHAWNETSAELPPSPSVRQLVEARAASDPSAVAVVAGAEQLSYGQLNERANRLAHHLRALGVGPEQLVAVHLRRTPEMLVALLGVLKAGAAYLPLDPEYPAARLAFMLADSLAPVLLTDSRLRDSIPGHQARVICMDTDWPVISQSSESDPLNLVALDNLAYLIYTSGSTGTPKGVAVTHGALLNLVSWHLSRYSLSAADRATQLAGLSFDASVWEIWPCLAAGASLYLPDEETRRSPERLVEWLAAQSITFCFMPTPLAEAALAADWPEGSKLKALLTGGDQLRRGPGAEHGFRLVNHYGPTENTVVTTCAEVEPGQEGLPPIGRPIANTRVYVLDGEGEPAPAGVPGELYAGGQGLARGYHGRPALTAERFVPDPHSGLPGARLYRTGDLVRYLRDGRIEFLGRIDHQVKVRGFRIEPGEVEAVLVGHELVKECVVLAADRGGGENQLIAYVVKKEGMDAAASQAAPANGGESGGRGEHAEGVRSWRSYMRERVPEAMVPSAFMVLDELPRTPSGKVDRKGLPELDVGRSGGGEYVAPRDDAERAVERIWAELLGLERVSIHDNFFDLGGHSLMATQVVSRIRSTLGVELPLRALFANRTIADLAENVETFWWLARGEGATAAAGGGAAREVGEL